MKKYKFGETEVEAVEFNMMNKDMVLNWASEKQQNVYPITKDGKPCIVVPTFEGKYLIECSVGDYLIYHKDAKR